MRLYHATYTDRATGRQREAEKWTLEFRDHCEIVRHLTLYRDKSSSGEVGRQVERLISIRLSKSEPKPEMIHWIAGCDSRLRNRLAEWDLIDPVRFASSKPLTEHLTEWQAALGSKGDTALHVEKEHGRAKRLLVDICRFETYQQIEPEAVRKGVSAIMLPAAEDSQEPPKAISPKTRNYYLRAVKGFCRWMVDEGRALRNPLACLKGANQKAVEADVRHARRALPSDELRRLLQTTAAGEERYGMTGPERALAYRLAAETGLRAGELHGLTKGNFRLDASPAVILEKTQTKNGKGATLPLRPETAALLTEHLRDRLPKALAFNFPRLDTMVDVLKGDLDTAGVTYNLHGRFADWHSLRHTFITNLANSGIHPKVAQDLARHSDINLTLSRYTHTVMEQRAEAVNRLPDLDATPAGEAVREATTDSPISGQERQAERQASCKSFDDKDKAGIMSPSLSPLSYGPVISIGEGLSASLSTQHPSGPVSWLPVASWPADSSMLAVWEDRIRQTQKLDRPRQDTRSCQMG